MDERRDEEDDRLFWERVLLLINGSKHKKYIYNLGYYIDDASIIQSIMFSCNILKYIAKCTNDCAFQLY